MDILELHRRQGLSLSEKVALSLAKIKLWYDYWEGDVYVSVSGGKHSLVLLSLVRSICPDVPAVFVEKTGATIPVEDNEDTSPVHKCVV